MGTKPMIVLSLTFFFLNLFLFCTFFIILGLKYICYPDRWSSLLRNPTTSKYAGCFPMGATTLLNVAVTVINGQSNFGGKSFLYFIWAMWWLDVFISFVCCWVGVHAMWVYTNSCTFFLRLKVYPTLGSHSRITLWIQWPQCGYSPSSH